MGRTSNFQISRKKENHTEHLRINLDKGRINATLNVLAYVDKDTKQHITYIPSLDISGYGETQQKAMEMLRYSLDNFGNYITSFPMNKINAELANLGWKKTMFHKEYSRTYVDIDGELKNFNAENDKVEHLTLQTA